ncbi:MAG TPA: stage II sporulation protein M [Acidimicrobiales bacterium]|jgi:uncharacterized membrane protein SpoIIM required for sporulation|nr:stage II sporulation protein M [Acidimicrobiales bacterium]
MNLERFVSTRAAEWRDLDALVRRAAGHPERLATDELVALGEGYRAAAADLSLARRAFPHQPVTEDLERLVASARAVVYSRATRDESVGRYFSSTLWREVRGLSWLLWLAVGVTVAATALGALWALEDPQSAAGLLPTGFHVSVHTRGGFYGISVPARGGLAAYIFVHNIVVAFLVIALGFLWGVPSAGLLAYNGLVLGVLGALEWRGGGFSQFVRLVVPHGLLELSCFALAGAAGFSLARAVIDPGRTSRADALAAAAPRTAAAVLCVVAFLVAAGAVEGFVTPWDLPLPAALALGVSLCAAFWAAVVVRGRPPRAPVRPEPQTLASDFSRA